MLRRLPSLALAVTALLLLLVHAPGCADATVVPRPSSVDDAGPTDDADTVDASIETDAGIPTYTDGTPTRVACTSTLGRGLTPNTHGRLDGVLVAVVAANERSCPADPQHLHLQVRVSGAVYDIAVNLDGFEGETDVPLPGGAFVEGWHPTVELEYVRDLGLRSTMLTLTNPTSIRQRVVTLLANANHVAIFGTTYPGSDGAHLIHRQSGARDGAIAVDPLAAKAHMIAFRFIDDVF